MRFAVAYLALFLSPVSPVLAGDFTLGLPVDCVLGKTCYIQNYVDADPTPSTHDFTCGPLSYDGHKGTDFALPAVNDVWKNVNVLATASGTVRATRDGMTDQLQSTPNAPDIGDKDCGNGLVIDHGDGWSTQYCHMMNGSIAVQKGDRVTKGTRLGNIGLSGNTEFPHLHLSVKKHGDVVDPFAPQGTQSCGEPLPTPLWQDQVPYQSTGILSVGISDGIPSYTSVKGGTAAQDVLSSKSSALVVFGFAYGGQKGDIMRMRLSGPEGDVVVHDEELVATKAQYFNAVGRKTRSQWPEGTYTATVQILRGGEVVDTKNSATSITR